MSDDESIDWDAVFFVHAAVQWGFVADRQLIAAGADRWLIGRRVRAKRWLRIYPGVLAAPGYVATFQGLLFAAYLSLGAAAFVSGEAAAMLQRFHRARTDEKVEIYVPGHEHKRHREFPIHVTNVPLSRQLTMWDDKLPITTRERTWIELLPFWSVERLQAALDAEVAAGRIDFDLLLDLAVAWAHRGRRGSGLLEVVFDGRAPGYVPPHSELERVMIELLEAAGFPPPERQAKLDGIREEGLVDFRYRDPALSIEVDGRTWHARLAQIEKDNRRDAESSANQIGVARLSYRAVVHDPDWVIEILGRHFAAAGWTRRPSGLWVKDAAA